MKKKLKTEVIANELSGSVFFPQKQAKTTPPLSQHTEDQNDLDDTVTPRYHDTKQDTTISSNRDTILPFIEDERVEGVRKAVRQVGKEAATQRLTLEEKQDLADIEYSYKRQGIKTSGNEIIRIATNYIVREYRDNGENSILAKVLRKLNS